MPGTGEPSQLREAETVTLNTVVSGGKVIVTGTLPFQPELQQGNRPVLAYAINFQGDTWLEGGPGERYHTLDPLRISTTSGQDGQNPQMVLSFQATIPFVNGAFFHPNLRNAQSLLVFVGRQAFMQVDPTNGVSGADDSATYSVRCRLPKRTIVSTSDSILDGIQRPGAIQLTLARTSKSTQAEVYRLDVVGNLGVLAALQLPETVTIPAGEHIASFVIDFDPRRTSSWPGDKQTVTLFATASTGSISTTLNFAGNIAVTTTFLPLPRLYSFRECSRRTQVDDPQPTRQVSGPCVNSADPPCPYDSGLLYLFYTPFECTWIFSSSSRCTVSLNLFFVESSTSVTNTIVECTIDPGIFGVIWKATVKEFHPEKGNQCISEITPNDLDTPTWNLEDCR